MTSLFEWLVKERCLWHAEPMFDRDLSGHAVFRCPRCMETWPILPDHRPRHAHAAPLRFDAAASARRRVTARPGLRALAPGQ